VLRAQVEASFPTKVPACGIRVADCVLKGLGGRHGVARIWKRPLQQKHFSARKAYHRGMISCDQCYFGCEVQSSLISNSNFYGNIAREFDNHAPFRLQFRWAPPIFIGPCSARCWKSFTNRNSSGGDKRKAVFQKLVKPSLTVLRAVMS